MAMDDGTKWESCQKLVTMLFPLRELHLPFINLMLPQFLLESGLIERLDRLVILYGCELRGPGGRGREGGKVHQD